MEQFKIKFELSNEEFRELEDWLKTDLLNSKSGRGFYNNWDMILRANDGQEIAVIKDKDIIIGFSIWNEGDICISIDLFEIKKEYRKSGIGKYFFDELSKKFIHDDYLVIKLFCEPQESEEFWKKMDFRKTPDTASTHQLAYYKPLIQINELQRSVDHNNKLELWDLEPFEVQNSKPRWTWSISDELPILHPCNDDWNIRLTIDGEIVRESKIKWFSRTGVTFNSFIYIPGIIEIDYHW